MSPLTQQQMDEIVQRRFGQRFPDRPPCKDPAMIECANYKCQELNRCRLKGRALRERKAEGP